MPRPPLLASMGAAGSAPSLASHPVPQPCGRGEDDCHRFPVGATRQLRYVLIRFSGIWDTYYVGVNRVRLYSGDGREVLYKILAANGSAEAAKEAEPVKGDGWWAPVGEQHTLLVELEEDVALAAVGVFCANAGATPKEIHIYDFRDVDAAACSRRDSERAPVCGANVVSAPPVAVHSVCAGCGSGDNQCCSFPLSHPEPVRHLLLRFSGIHNSHYIGINRLRLYCGSRELRYTVVAADGSAVAAKDAQCVAVDGGWWAVCDADHSLFLELEKPERVTTIGMWCANAGATPKEMRVCLDMSWLDELVAALTSVAASPSATLAPAARRLIADNVALLAGLARGGHPKLQEAVLGPVIAGMAPQFPLKEDDALGRLQASLFCDMVQEAVEKQDFSVRCQGVTGNAWQEYPAGALPVLEDGTEITVISQLVQPPSIRWSEEEWLGTRLFVPPGGFVSLLSADCGEGWRVRVGAHTDDITCREIWPRWPRVSLVAKLVPNKVVKIFSPFGGLVYLLRRPGAPSVATVRCSGNACLQPTVSLSEGLSSTALEQCRGGWVDCEGHKVILTLPVRSVKEAIKAGGDVLAALRFYDDLWESYNKLSPRTDPRRQRVVPDLEISNGWMHCGYPIMTHFGEIIETSSEHPIPRILDVKRVKVEGNWGLFHELGHNMQRDSWTFEGTVEVTVNLFTLWGYNQLAEDCIHKHIETPQEFYDAGCPRAKWNEDPFLALRTYAQVLATFGWEPLQQTFKAYAEEGEVQRDYAKQVQDFVRRWSIAIGRDLRPHWKRWGFGDTLGALNDPALNSLEPWAYE